MTLSPLLNCWRNCKRNRSSGSLAWKQRDSSQHGQNQGPDIWAGTRYTSKVTQRPLSRVSLGCLYKFHLLWTLFQLGPRGMQWYLWHSEARSQGKEYWTGQASRWQTNERGHSGEGETWGGAILLLPWGQLILRWRLWTRFHHKMPCRMGQIQWAPAHSHNPLISHYLQGKS